MSREGQVTVEEKYGEMANHALPNHGGMKMRQQSPRAEQVT